MGDWYSILYRRINQSDDIVVFIPVYYINGIYNKEDESFVDNGNNLYFSNKEYEIITTSEEHTHYHSIHIDDLRDMYKIPVDSDDIEDIMMSAEECAGKHFEYFKNNILIGKLNRTGKIMEFFDMPFEKWQELTQNQHYCIEGEEGRVTLSKATLESVLLGVNSETFEKKVNKWIDNIVSLEKMYAERNVTKVEMSMDGGHIVGFGLASANGKSEPVKSQRQVELEELFSTQKVDVSADEKGPHDILKYIKDRMILPKDQNIIESILVQIIGNLEAAKPEEINHIFSIGPTGTGKTYIYKLLGKILDVPVIIEDCNNIVQEGYVGTSIEDLIVKIYIQSGCSIERASRAIIYLDEIDKIASRGNSVSDVGAQSALLKFIEGSVYTVTVDKLRGTKVTIDTSMMSICAGGAFSDLTYGTKHIGFASLQTPIIKKCPEFNDLVNYGMLPELIGRFSSFIYYDNYTKDEFRKVLLESLDSPFFIKKEEFQRRFQVDLVATEDFFDALADKSFEKQNGFRGIKLTITTTLLPAQMRLQFDNRKYRELVVSSETVKNANEYVLK